MATGNPGIPWIITLSFHCLSPSSHGCPLCVYAFTPSILILIISTRVHHASVWLWLDYYTIKILLWNKVTFLIAKINFFGSLPPWDWMFLSLPPVSLCFSQSETNFLTLGYIAMFSTPMFIFPPPPSLPRKSEGQPVRREKDVSFTSLVILRH